MTAPEVRQQYESRTGLVFFVDNNCLEPGKGGGQEDIDAMGALRALHDQGLILLAVTGELRKEQERNRDDGSRSRLLALIDGFIEYHSLFVLGESRLGGEDVLASTADVVTFDAVESIVFRRLRTLSPQHRSDARHIALTKKYGVTGFVTADRRLLGEVRTDLMQELEIQIFSPQRALAFSQRMAERNRIVAEREDGRELR